MGLWIWFPPATRFVLCEEFSIFDFFTQVVVTMEHCSKTGAPKILKSCALPLTGKKVVSLIITEMAVFEVSPTEGLTLIEKAPEVSVDDIKAKTEAPFKVSENLIDMQQ